MPDWALGIIASIVSSGTVAGAILGYMRTNGRNSKNGVKRKEFTDQVNRCNERFLDEANTNGRVEVSLNNIERRLENIEGWLKR